MTSEIGNGAPKLPFQITEEQEKRIAHYLHEVRVQLVDAPPKTRDRAINELRARVTHELRRLGNGTPRDKDVEVILNSCGSPARVAASRAIGWSLGWCLPSMAKAPCVMPILILSLETDAAISFNGKDGSLVDTFCVIGTGRIAAPSISIASRVLHTVTCGGGSANGSRIQMHPGPSSGSWLPGRITTGVSEQDDRIANASSTMVPREELITYPARRIAEQANPPNMYRVLSVKGT